MIPRFPPEWANSREAFRKAVRQSEYHKYSASPQRNVTGSNLNIDHLPTQSKQDTEPTRSPRGSISLTNKLGYNLPSRDTMFLIVPREVMSIFVGLEKLDNNNMKTWEGHMRDSLEICDLWDIVIGNERKPSDKFIDKAEAWIYRDKIARVIIKVP
ncbi:BgTH12-05205 [Blumeria graminis f. sp. triticale]|uniref:BgTH12-05205 n=1 Tax=Blumeria graminis f. sp. triticale TaxID=1689686 RepID=A0A9W4GEI8_BLUGR|nr:BgTH12-05205 [Blumeria graminis f. sp. triticale]